MNKVITFLNGKKTMIGAAILFAAAFLDQVVVGYWGVTASWIEPMIKTLDWIGMPLTGIGGGHKAIKYFQK